MDGNTDLCGEIWQCFVHLLLDFRGASSSGNVLDQLKEHEIQMLQTCFKNTTLYGFEPNFNKQINIHIILGMVVTARLQVQRF